MGSNPIGATMKYKLVEYTDGIYTDEWPFEDVFDAHMERMMLQAEYPDRLYMIERETGEFI